MELYENIQQLRKAAGLSQEQLAEKMGVSRQAVSKWESGQASPGLDRLQDLAQALGVTMYRLLGVETPVEASAQDPDWDQELWKKVRAFLQAEEASRWRRQKRLVGLSLLLGVLLLSAMAVLTVRMTDRLQNQVNALNGQVSAISGNVDEQIRQITTELREQMAQEESLVADYDWRVSQADIPGQQLEMVFSVTPRTYREGMECTVAVLGRETHLFPAELHDGVFTAYGSIPAEKEQRLQVRFLQDGKTETQLLETFYDLASNYMMEVAGENGLHFDWDAAKGQVHITGEAVTYINPAYEGYDGRDSYAANFPVEGEIRVLLDGTRLTEIPIDMTGLLAEGAPQEVSDCYFYTQLDYVVEGYRPGDEITVNTHVLDNLGNEREVQICSFTN